MDSPLRRSGDTFLLTENQTHQLLLMIAGSTQKELAAQIRYLKVENQIVRSKLPARVAVTPQAPTANAFAGGPRPDRL